ncbi:MAG TPA: hypothetical protein VKK79_25910 [Candidatus Lokiarchaeia archaeon]|nr:hypothetical protein [Candidatus Lokiarchaeia archaeon]
MPGKENQIMVRVDEYLAQYIDALVGTTLLGTNRAEVVRSIVKRWIEDSMNEYVKNEIGRKANAKQLEEIKAALQGNLEDSSK